MRRLATGCRLVLLICVLVLGVEPGGVRGQEIAPGYWERSALPQMGLATFYAPGMMEYVLGYRLARQELVPCAECVGEVAMLRAGDIGRRVWLQPPGGELAGPFLVVDCARTEDVQPLLDRNWVVDVSYDLAQTWGIEAPLDGVIVWADPAENDSSAAGIPARLPYVNPGDVVISAPTSVPPTVAPLPTRLPVPREAGDRGNGGQVSQAEPASSAAIITTPTPPGAQAMADSTPTAEPSYRASPDAVTRGAAGGRPTDVGPPVFRPAAVSKAVGSGHAGQQVLATPLRISAGSGAVPAATSLSADSREVQAPAAGAEEPRWSWGGPQQMLRSLWRAFLDMVAATN